MKLKVRRLSVVGVAFLMVLVWLMVNPESYETVFVGSGEDGVSAVGSDV